MTCGKSHRADLETELVMEATTILDMRTTYSSEISVNKREEDVVGDKLRENTFVDGVTHGEISEATATGSRQRCRQIDNLELYVRRSNVGIRHAHEASIGRVFPEQTALIGTSQSYLGRRFF